MAALLAGFVIALALAVRENKKVFSFIGAAAYYRLAAIIILGIFARYALASFLPNVMNDEYFYMATAENMARAGKAFPYILHGFPLISTGEAQFIPPYPQLWPVLVSFVYKITGEYTFRLAGYVSMFLSCLIPLPAFFAGYFFFDSLPEKKRPFSGVICGLFCAFLWAVVPVILRLTGCASPEVASTLFIGFFLALLALYYRYPSPKTFLAMILALSLAIHARPENLLYVFLLIPVFVKMKFKPLKDVKNLTAIVLVFFIILSVMIMGMGKGDTERGKVFQIQVRKGFDSKFQNFTANLKNNFLFLFGKNAVNPLLFTLLAVGGILFLVLQDDKGRGYLLLGWFAMFFLVFSPFPFGDFSNSHSQDAYRFSLHLYYPIIMAASYCCFRLWDMVKTSRLDKLAPAVTIFMLVLISGSLYLNMPFLRSAPSDRHYFTLLRGVADKLPHGESKLVMISDDPCFTLLERYAMNIPSYLIENEKDVEMMKPGNTRIFFYTPDNPSDFILANFEIEIFLRHIDDVEKTEYSIYELKKFQQ